MGGHKGKSQRNSAQEFAELRARLAEAEETLRAIREGEVDAVVVSGSKGEQVFSLTGSEAVYRLIAEQMREAAFTVSLEGRILFCNQQFSSLLGTPQEEIIGRPLRGFVPAAQRSEVDWLLDRCQKEPVRQRLVFQRGDETPVPAHISAAMLAGPGGPSICVVAADLSELENSTETIQQLHRKEEELQSSNEKLRRADVEITESRNYLASIISAIADPVFVKDSRHRYVLVNEAFVEFSGRPREELIGKTPADFLPPQEAKASLEQDDRVLQTGKKDAAEIQTKDAAGRVRIVNEVKTLFATEAGEKLVVGCMRDVTAARVGEQAALRAKAEWERTFNAVPELIVVLDARHRIRRVNKHLAERLGVSPEALAGRSCHEVIHGASHPEGACPHSFTCGDGQEHYVEVHEERLGGDFLISTTPVFDESGKVAGSVHVARDITERKKTDAALREAAKLRTDLISLINHEYANGLCNLKLAMALLRSTEPGNPDETRSHSYEVLERTVEKLKGYTANFLNLHRMESGKFELALQPVAIRSVLLDDMITLRPLAEAKRQNLNLESAIPEGLPVAVRADPDCLSLIINNLVTNAVKYTPEGGRIAVRLHLEKQVPLRVRFSIEDNGIGMSPQDIERILSGPYRTDEAQHVAKGFGVGLVVVRKLLEQHGSRLQISSEPGKGSRISFSLPVWTESPAPDAVAVSGSTQKDK